MDLATIVDERLKEIKPMLYNGVKIDVTFSPDEESVKRARVSLDVTEKTRIGIVIDNIIHNAIKYSYENGHIDIILERQNGSVNLTIQDFGCGISNDDVDRIFDSGFTRRALGHPQGTGMGLTTVKQILDQLGWKITVDSRKDHGSSFTITFPVTQAS